MEKGNKKRITKTRRMMDKENIDLLILRLPENVLLLSDYWSMFGFSFLVFPLEGNPTLIVGSCEEREATRSVEEIEILSYSYGVLDSADPYESVAKLLRDRWGGKKYRTIGIDRTYELVSPPWNTAEMMLPSRQTEEMYKLVFPQADFLDVSGLLLRERANKNQFEMQKIRIANKIGNIGLSYFVDHVTSGVSNIELVAGIESEIMQKGTGYQGAERVRAFAQVASGSEETSFAFRPNEVTTRRKIKRGDLVLLELAVVADGYWCDKTRVRAVDSANDKQVKAWEAVKEGQEAAINVLRPGVAAGIVDAAGREVIKTNGFGKDFFHITGHGLGFRYHEPYPSIGPESAEILEPGMVFSVEPGVYNSSFGGIRIEDNVVISEGGVEVLAPFRKELL